MLLISTTELFSQFFCFHFLFYNFIFWQFFDSWSKCLSPSLTPSLARAEGESRKSVATDSGSPVLGYPDTTCSFLYPRHPYTLEAYWLVVWLILHVYLCEVRGQPVGFTSVLSCSWDSNSGRPACWKVPLSFQSSQMPYFFFFLT